MDRPFCLLGGYGNAGIRTAELLLRATPHGVLLAGRSIDKAASAAEALNRRFEGNRVTTVAVDAADRKQQAAVFARAGFIVNASSTAHLTQTVVEAALDAGVDYLDTQLSLAPKWEALRTLAPRIEAEGRCVITDGGYHPGLPAAMVRYAAARHPTLATAHVGSCIQLDWKGYTFSDASVVEFVDELRDFHPRFYQQGRWVESWNGMRSFDFRQPFGIRSCTPSDLDEMHRLPDLIPGLAATGFYVAGFNPLTDYVVMPLGLMALRTFPKKTAKPFGRLFLWSVRRGARPPYGVQLVLDAEATARGPARPLRMTVAHPDGYFLTAAPVVSCLLQVVAGRRPIGLHHQALLVDPEVLFRDLQAWGVTVTWEE